MVVLIVLIGVFLLSLLVLRLVKDKWEPVTSGNAAMFAMLCFSALGHFMYTEGFEMMMPPFIPFKRALIYITALLEIAGGLGLLIPKFRRISALMLIIFFVLILPVNIYGALKNVNYQLANYEGKGPAYLWQRVPIQAFFIAWVWYFGLRRKTYDRTRNNPL